MPHLLSLGSIEFINSLPVDLGMASGAVPSEARIVRGTPAQLNEKMLKGELDASPVSAFWYAQHQKEFLLFPDLSISSESGVQSVLLFSRFRFLDLKNKRIAVTDKGRTTPVLLEILCRERYGFMPHLETKASVVDGIPDGFDAALLIGDDALKTRDRLTSGKDGSAPLYVFDLAEEWRVWTRMPFVFAVWAARRDSFLAFPEKVSALHDAVLRSKKWGLEHSGEVVKEAEKRTSLPERVLKAYFDQLSYDLDATLKKGMRLYFDAARQCKLLKFVDNFDEIEKRPEKNYRNVAGEFDEITRNSKKGS